MPKAIILTIDEIKACDGVNDKPVTLITEDIQTESTASVLAIAK
jgi:neutral amino acid transport system substrate-binding protein